MTTIYVLNILYIENYLCNAEVSFLNSSSANFALLMKALSDETRVEIFKMLAGGELCACKILEEFEITQPTLSYHMKILIESKLINSRRDGVWMRYSINRDSLSRIQDWLQGISQSLDNPHESMDCQKC